MNHRWSRSVPALGVALLLSLAIVQSLRQGTARAASKASGTSCLVTTTATGSMQIFPLTTTTYVEQPLPPIGNVAACSLSVPYNYYAFAQLALVQWDPTALAPDPNTVALRTQNYNPSQLQYNHARAALPAPIVTRSIPGVAEPPRGTIAVQWRETDYWDQLDVYYDPDGPTAFGVAQQVTAPSGDRSPLPGAHPVLSVELCDGGDAAQALKVVQAVMTTNALLDTSAYEIAQRFRVPTATTVRWVELAGAAGAARGAADYGSIAILEGQNLPTLGTQLPAAMVEARMSKLDFHDLLGNGISEWFTHFAFDHTIALLPNHDYWLVARVDHDYWLHARALTGTENADFTGGIGPTVQRAAPGAPFTAVSNRALAFRVIGEPILAVDAPAPSPAGSMLRLGATPNPSRGPVTLAWSGAKGPLAIDVLDARGRRVQHADVPGAGSGRWVFRGFGADDRPLPAGLYFVRASDASGQRALQRVVLVR